MDESKKESGLLTKLYIEAYDDKTFSGRAEAVYSLLVNPINYDEKKGIKYGSEKGNQPVFKEYETQHLTFKFVIDGTGAVCDVDVVDEVKHLEDVVYRYDGEIHEPRYLKVCWGTLNFSGRLQSINKKYVYFERDGKPLRVEVEIELVKFIDSKTLEVEKKNSSPDLSHIIIVTAGDSLPILCKKIYGSPIYADDVARFNKLTSFQDLEPGSRIIFPRLSN